MQRFSPATIILLVLAALAAIGLIYVYATKDGGNQDALTDDEVITAQSPAEAQAQDLCSSSETLRLIKDEVLRRSAALRSPELDPFGDLTGAAVFRVENPVLESDGEQGGAIRCSGSLAISLPPGVAAAGNRTRLASNIDYELRGERLALAGVDAIVSALASVTRVEEPEDPLADVDGNALGSDPLAPLAPGTPIAPETAPAPRANPSFDCDDAATRGEVAVCSDPGLAALDRNMAAQYRRAIGSATPAQRALLTRTRDRFLGFRDNCQTRGCIGDAYVGRMREIRDIMEGRWQAQR